MRLNSELEGKTCEYCDVGPDTPAWKAELWWCADDGSMGWIHSSVVPCCNLCAAEMQLEHLKKQLPRMAELEREIQKERLKHVPK